MLDRIKIRLLFVNFIQYSSIQSFLRLVTDLGCLCPFRHFGHIANDEPACAREDCYTLRSVEAKSPHGMEVLVDE